MQILMTLERRTDCGQFCLENWVINNIRPKVTTFRERLLKLIKGDKGETKGGSSYKNAVKGYFILIRQSFEHKLRAQNRLKEKKWYLIGTSYQIEVIGSYSNYSYNGQKFQIELKHKVQ